MLRMKERVTISVEPEALETVRAEVKAGKAPSVSAAVEELLVAQSRRQALKELLDYLDDMYGPLTGEEEAWGRKELDHAFGELSSSTPEPRRGPNRRESDSVRATRPMSVTPT